MQTFFRHYRGLTLKPVKLFQKIAQFLKEVRLEMKKVNWPTREETVRHTLIVIGVSIAVAIFLGGIDYVFKAVLNKFFL